MTHKEGVEIAYRWVLKNGGVGFAFKELKSISDEIPDVIGFDSWQSILIEVKVSRSDFLSDKKKPHRAKGMGNWRFYLCPKGMIRKEELPEKWGLIYVDGKGKARIEYDCRKKKIACDPYTIGGNFGIPEQTIKFRITRADENRFEADVKEERRIMYTALRRLFIKGHMKCIYDKEYDKSATPAILIERNEEIPLENKTDVE